MIIHFPHTDWKHFCRRCSIFQMDFLFYFSQILFFTRIDIRFQGRRRTVYISKTHHKPYLFKKKLYERQIEFTYHAPEEYTLPKRILTASMSIQPSILWFADGDYHYSFIRKLVAKHVTSPNVSPALRWPLKHSFTFFILAIFIDLVRLRDY